MTRSRALLRVGAASAVLLTGGCVAAAEPEFTPPPVPMTDAIVAGSDFSAASIADAAQFFALGDGDLWPNCWGDDDNIYTAHGDGMGFGTEFADIGADVISGAPNVMTGTTLAMGDAVGSIWTPGTFTRKPTGMACVDGSLYLAVQDLRGDFNQAPASSISRSDDKGVTWTWDESGPMFDDGVFTTVFFLDYGKNYTNAPDDFVYAYGLDGNWRDSFDDSAADPVDLYLGRVPKGSVQDRAAWEFFGGEKGGEPTWTSTIEDRVAVLHDDRRAYPTDTADFAPGTANLSVLSQGSVVYNKPLDRYIYTSWTELTFEFYESPTPWGPWTLFLSRDFGRYPWSADLHGGYGVTIPSKFISEDGRDMLVQSNVCPCAPAGMSVYDFALRQLKITP